MAVRNTQQYNSNTFVVLLCVIESQDNKHTCTHATTHIHKHQCNGNFQGELGLVMLPT